MKDFVHNLKQKPEHVRKRIALGTASGATALIAIAWVVAMVTTHAFELSSGPTTVATQDSAPLALTGTNIKSNFTQLVGAVGAAAHGSTTAPAITVVDGTSSATTDRANAPASNSATVLSF
ncbi:MAG: hypothetical protein V4480_03975 [Patescibacteria group bacterium]